MQTYLYLEVTEEPGPRFPFSITHNGAILAQSSTCKSKQEVAFVMRNFLRGLWRRGHITGSEFLVIRDEEVSRAWNDMLIKGNERPEIAVA